MTIIDYKKETGEFHIHIFDTLSPGHISFLQKFATTDNNSNEMKDLFDDDISHKLYYDLCDCGFLEVIYDHSIEKTVVRLTKFGKKIIEKIS